MIFASRRCSCDVALFLYCGAVMIVIGNGQSSTSEDDDDMADLVNKLNTLMDVVVQLKRELDNLKNQLAALADKIENPNGTLAAVKVGNCGSELT